ncbi:hypothetical protein F5883DRAFT_587675 [Diaporthe sp. PMI_573]|nr:hypothetical protein F5883DRAFT_587675 [Diaporthaceae sp. PMI_573]
MDRTWAGDPMEGVERTLPVLEGSFGRSFSQNAPRWEPEAAMQDPIPCFVCAALFPTPEELYMHLRSYQSEITALIVKLHELLTHHGRDPKFVCQTPGNSNDAEQHYERFGRGRNCNQDARSPAWAPKRHKYSERTIGRETAYDQRFACPHEDCKGLQITFRRQQDLIRHYTIHCECNEFCQYCSTTFTQASKYITHNCLRKGEGNQKKYIKMRIKELRKDAKRELRLRNTGTSG